MRLAERILRLNLFFNADFERLQRLSCVGLGCLLAALTAASALAAAVEPKPAWEVAGHQVGVCIGVVYLCVSARC